jgi:hypothetical protein
VAFHCFDVSCVHAGISPTNVRYMNILSDILGPHSGVAEDSSVLGCDVVWLT